MNTFRNLHNLITKIDIFIRLTTDISRNVFERINRALDNIVGLVVQKDLEFMYRMLVDYFGVYHTHYGYLVNVNQKALEEIIAMLPITANESDPMYTDKVNPTMNGRVHLLIDQVSFIKSNPETKWIKYIPSRLARNELSSTNCQTFQTNIRDVVERTVLRNKSGDIPGDSYMIYLSRYDVNELNRLYMMHTSNECLSALASELDLLIRSTNDINVAILQILASRPRFEYKMNNEQVYLHTLKSTATWLSQQLMAYAENTTTKLEISESFTSAMLSNIELALDRIVAGIERKSINPLLAVTESILKDTKEWYDKSLNALLALVPFYDDRGIEDRLRAWNIWRHLVARWETTDILQFRYPASESWRSWELSITLEDFVRNGSATTMISSMLEEYRQILQSELFKLQMECHNAKENVIGAIQDVRDDFQGIRTKSLLESNFVLWV